jgi:hypothetical protein
MARGDCTEFPALNGHCDPLGEMTWQWPEKGKHSVPHRPRVKWARLRQRAGYSLSTPRSSRLFPGLFMRRQIAAMRANLEQTFPGIYG